MERFKMIGVSAIFLLCLLSGCFAFAQGGAAGSGSPVCSIQNSLPAHASCREERRGGGSITRKVFACRHREVFTDPTDDRRQVSCLSENLVANPGCRPYVVRDSNLCLVPENPSLEGMAYCVSCETSRGRPPRAPRGSRPR